MGSQRIGHDLVTKQHVVPHAALGRILQKNRTNRLCVCVCTCVCVYTILDADKLRIKAPADLLSGKGPCLSS